jgi:hypothetical protein
MSLKLKKKKKKKTHYLNIERVLCVPLDASATNPTSPLVATSDLTLSVALPVACAIALTIMPSPTPSSMPANH